MGSDYNATIGTAAAVIGTTIGAVTAFPTVNPLILIVASIILIALLSILYHKITNYLKPKSEPIHSTLKWISAEKLKQKNLLGGRPYTHYVPRKTDEDLRGLLIANKNALVIGSPLAGKTRTVYEVIRILGSSVEVVIPSPGDLKNNDFFPKVDGNKVKIVILDEINNFVEKDNFEELLAVIRNKNLIIVATCQTGDPFKLIEQKLELDAIFSNNIINIDSITEDEARRIAKKENINWKDTEFDGTIGSVFLKLREMRKRYDALQETEKDILKTIKKLHISGIYEGKHIFQYEWIETAFNAKYPGIKLDWEHVLTSLKGSELVSVTDEKKLHVEEVYLEKIVELNDKQSELTILNEMLNGFSGKTDVLYNIGYRASSLALIRVEKGDFLTIAIKAYEEALNIFTPDNLPLDYAQTQNNLGTAYGILASVQDKKNNIEKAIKAYHEALKVRTLDEFSVDYATTQNNLGNVYGDLASVEDKKNNIEKAIKAYNEALKVRTFDGFPIQYAMTQNNLGAAYWNLASVEEDKKNNIEKAIKAYNEALKVRTLDEFPIQYAMTQNNLGAGYRTLAGLASVEEDKKNNIEKAIKAYHEALKVRTLDEFPVDYATTQNNLGNVYRKLASLEDCINNSNMSIIAFQEALKIYTLKDFPIKYAIVQKNLCTTYGNLAIMENYKNNIEKAIKACQEALKVYDREKMELDAEPLRRMLPVLQAQLQQP